MFLTTDNNIKWRKMGVAAIVTAVLVVAGIAWFDKPLYILMRELDCPIWKWFDVIFDGQVWIFAAMIVAAVFCVKKALTSGVRIRDDKNRLSLWFFIKNSFVKTKTSNAFLIFYSVLATGVLVKVLKVLIGRARPVFFEALDMTGFFPLSFDWAFNSMPSGHTSVSFAGLVMIGMLAPRYKAFTWTLAILIGVSRVAIGAHWPTDVILGAFIGMVMADIIKGTLLKKK